MSPPALHNPNEMGSGTYELSSSNTNKTNKTKNNQPNPNLDKDSVQNNRPIQNLGTMKDNIPSWRINKDTGVESFWYQDKASKDRNTREFEKMNNPSFQRRKGKELAAFSENYNPNEEGDGEGIWFGGVTKSRKKNTKRVSRKKNTTKSGKSGKSGKSRRSGKSRKSKSKKTMKKM